MLVLYDFFDFQVSSISMWAQMAQVCRWDHSGVPTWSHELDAFLYQLRKNPERKSEAFEIQSGFSSLVVLGVAYFLSSLH